MTRENSRGESMDGRSSAREGWGMRGRGSVGFAGVMLALCASLIAFMPATSHAQNPGVMATRQLKLCKTGNFANVYYDTLTVTAGLNDTLRTEWVTPTAAEWSSIGNLAGAEAFIVTFAGTNVASAGAAAVGDSIYYTIEKAWFPAENTTAAAVNDSSFQIAGFTATSAGSVALRQGTSVVIAGNRSIWQGSLTSAVSSVTGNNVAFLVPKWRLKVATPGKISGLRCEITFIKRAASR